MQSQTIVYDICRDYVLDSEAILGIDLSNTILGHLRSRSLKHLCSSTGLFCREIHSTEVFRCLSQIQSFFKKNDVFVDDERCMLAAQNTFRNSEEQCAETNRRLDLYYSRPDLLDPDMREYLSCMERDIASMLGPFDDFFCLIPKEIRVTNGASATRPRSRSYPHMKIRHRMECSSMAEPYLNALSNLFGYGNLKCRKVNWNRVEAVPKNWKTHRLIACEPEGNIPLQLAFDNYAKRRLRSKWGINLRDQSRNQQYAHLGSISETTGENHVATVDLSAASDSLAFNTVAWLFPDAWFKYLTDVRSTHYRSPWGPGMYSKFSSMGNGCTFALETIVFASACRAVGSNINCVYGDDIIIESHLYENLRRLLHFLGFTVNVEKSFHEGPFRESCGKDYYDGVDVTPFYLRTWTEDYLPTLAHNINGLVSISKPEGRIWKRCYELVHSKGLPFVPYNLDSNSGILIDVPTSYDLGKIRSKSWILKYKRFVFKRRHRPVFDTRTLFLWYLDRYRSKIPNDERVESFIRSRVPTDSHKYVRKWVCWRPPATVAPVHIYMWADYITRSPDKES